MNTNIKNTLDSIIDIETAIDIAEQNVYQSLYDEYDKLYKQKCLEEFYIQESVSDTIKKGFSFMIKLIKKAISMIKYGINMLISLITKLFKRHKKARNVNNILSDMNIAQVNESLVKSSQSDSSKEKIFYVDIDGDRVLLTPSISTRRKISKINNNINFFENKDQEINVRKQYGPFVITLIKYPETFSLLKNMIYSFDVKDDTMIVDKSKLTKLHTEYVKKVREQMIDIIADIEKNIVTEISLGNVKKLLNEVNSLQKYVDKIFNVSSNDAGADKYVNTAFGMTYIDNNKAFSEGNTRIFIDMLNQELININIGINSLIRDIKEIYVVDKSYHHSLSDENKIDEFINKMLSYGYPSNIIYTNIKICIKNNMFDDIKNGQTRAVLIDKQHQFVLKCALNSSGISANKTEESMYKSYGEHGINQYLAAIINTYKNKCIIKQEFCKDIGNVSDAEFNNLYETIDKLCKKYNIDVISDRKSDAVGRRVSDDSPVVVDYGIKSKFAAYIDTDTNTT